MSWGRIVLPAEQLVDPNLTLTNACHQLTFYYLAVTYTALAKVWFIHDTVLAAAHTHMTRDQQRGPGVFQCEFQVVLLRWFYRWKSALLAGCVSGTMSSFLPLNSWVGFVLAEIKSLCLHCECVWLCECSAFPYCAVLNCPTVKYMLPYMIF